MEPTSRRDEPEGSASKSFAHLFELFNWTNRDAVYRVRFADGDEFELTAVMAGQDHGKPPHGSATVVRQLHRSAGSSWPLENDIFFHLPDIAEVADKRTGEIVFQAV